MEQAEVKANSLTGWRAFPCKPGIRRQRREKKAGRQAKTGRQWAMPTQAKAGRRKAEGEKSLFLSGMKKKKNPRATGENRGGNVA